ncbi:MAG: transcription termination/antitermination factor NusG [Elusimicrobia bacterium]|nr:transcription termination/antitermination factor NusG [Elusimicrobiota bacterium]
MEKEYKFYVIQTLGGKEKNIRQVILNKMQEDIEKHGSSKIKQVILPEEKVIDIKKRKNVIKQRKILPRYLFIEMILDEETFWFINNIPGVGGFLGGKNPISVNPQEVEALQQLVKESEEEKPKPSVKFEKHDSVRIIDGPFANFSGEVDMVDEKKGKLRVLVSIFGRLTPVELKFYQVEKI